MNHRVLFPQTGRNMKPERSRPLTVPFVGADRAAAQFCGPRRPAGRLDRKPPARLASHLGAARLTRDARIGYVMVRAAGSGWQNAVITGVIVALILRVAAADKITRIAFVARHNKRPIERCHAQARASEMQRREESLES